MKTKTITKEKKSYEELLGIHHGYVKMVEVLTSKNNAQLRALKEKPISTNARNNKEYIIT